MSAAVCGKRPIFDDHYGTSCNVKKLRRGSSPLSVPGEAVSTVGDMNTSQDQDHLVLQLQDLFPNINRQILQNGLVSCGYDLHSAIERFKTPYAESEARQCTQQRAVSIGRVPSTSQSSPPDVHQIDSIYESAAMDGREWVELVVREMLSASDVADARVRATRALEAFETAMKLRCGSAIESLQKENAAMKEQLEGFLRDNHVLKRAVAIQHERREGEHENWSKEMEQLKQLLSHQQEHVKALELSNYALNVHLRGFQAGTTNALLQRFHPDVF